MTLVPLPFIAPQTVTLKPPCFTVFVTKGCKCLCPTLRLTSNLLLEYCSTLQSSEKITLLLIIINNYNNNLNNNLRPFNVNVIRLPFHGIWHNKANNY